MPTVDSIHLYPQANQYWELVKKTLREIFGVDPTPADVLRKEITTWPVQEQLLFYHIEPLNVAADLAGEELTEEQTKRYTSMAAGSGWYVSWASPTVP